MISLESEIFSMCALSRGKMMDEKFLAFFAKIRISW
jgi:hypothetical protein